MPWNCDEAIAILSCCRASRYRSRQSCQLRIHTILLQLGLLYNATISGSKVGNFSSEVLSVCSNWRHTVSPSYRYCQITPCGSSDSISEPYSKLSSSVRDGENAGEVISFRKPFGADVIAIDGVRVWEIGRWDGLLDVGLIVQQIGGRLGMEGYL